MIMNGAGECVVQRKSTRNKQYRLSYVHFAPGIPGETIINIHTRCGLRLRCANQYYDCSGLEMATFDIGSEDSAGYIILCRVICILNFLKMVDRRR